jgi:hypothetical protein
MGNKIVIHTVKPGYGIPCRVYKRETQKGRNCRILDFTLHFQNDRLWVTCHKMSKIEQRVEFLKNSLVSLLFKELVEEFVVRTF